MQVRCNHCNTPHCSYCCSDILHGTSAWISGLSGEKPKEHILQLF